MRGSAYFDSINITCIESILVGIILLTYHHTLLVDSSLNITLASLFIIVGAIGFALNIYGYHNYFWSIAVIVALQIVWSLMTVLIYSDVIHTPYGLLLLLYFVIVLVRNLEDTYKLNKEYVNIQIHIEILNKRIKELERVHKKIKEIDGGD